MKIAFLCASLEPARDGVGDYTRSLAVACAARGYACALLALRDPHLTANQERLANDIPALRLSPRLPLAARIADARSCLADFAPDWVSWQFAHTGYHPRGLVSTEARGLASLAAGRLTHVMLHELWGGLDRSEPWLNRFLGRFQRKGLLSLLHQLRTQRLHTTNVAYRAALAAHQWGAELLPLWGNIPIAQPRPGVLAPFLPTGSREGWLVAVTFGNIPREWDPSAVVAFFHAAASRLQRSPLLLVCGRAGQYGPAMLQKFSADGKIAVAATGELPAEKVSQILQAVDFGIAPHPWGMIGKSGAVAALIDHGLPVLASHEETWVRPPSDLPLPPPGLLSRLSDLTPEAVPAWLARRQPAASTLPKTADDFLESLTRS